MELAPGTLLQSGKYKIIGKLGQGGFGIAYRAHHQNLKRDVCIKEFFYSDLCERAQNSLDVTIITKSAEKLSLVNSFKKKFTKEAQRLAKFQHTNIVQVTDTFEENNTAYFVMEYLQGGSLEDLLNKEGTLSEQKTKELILPLIDALDAIHKTDLLHLDIKPANIMLRNNLTPVLIDFGISKYMELAGGVTTTAPVGISKGYAPLEQYGGSIADFSKATDIYSLCATMYKMVTGQTPPEPIQILSSGLKSPRNLNPQLSILFSKAITEGLSTKAIDRPQSIANFKTALVKSIVSQSKTVIILDKDNKVFIKESKEEKETLEPPKIKKAEPVLATAIEYFKRGETKRKEGQVEDAIKDYTRAIKKDSTRYLYFLKRARCSDFLAIYPDAIKDYSEVIMLNYKKKEVYFWRGMCYKKLNNFIPAIADFEAALKFEPTKLAYYEEKVICYEGLKEYSKAIEDYTKLIQLGALYSTLYFNRGQCYKNMGLVYFESASKDFYSALEIEGGRRFFWPWIETVIKTEFNYALTSLNKYVNTTWPDETIVYPNKATVYYELGMLYLNFNKRKLGILELKKANEMGNRKANIWFETNHRKWYDLFL